MNKLTKIALVLIVIGVIGSLLTIRSARDTSDWETKEQSFPANDLVNIEIESMDAEVEILPTTDAEVTVSYTNLNADQHLTTDVDDGKLFVQVDYKQWFNIRFFQPRPTLTVHLPEKTYEQLKVNNDNGDIKADRLQAGEIMLSTNNGQIVVNDIEGSILHADSDNGKIEISQVITQQIDAHTHNGKITLHDVEGNITSQTDNGDISLTTIALDQMIDFSTDNGRITIQTEQEPTNAVLDLRTDNGRIKVFGQSDWNTVIGDGEHVVKLVTKNGNITITN